MALLLLEAGLIILAWNRGWRWLSLIPLGVIFGLAIIVGIVIGLSGGDIPTNMEGAQITIDVLFIITMILMSIFPKKKKEIKE